tara:strand:+ start:112 stop:882 length:771 start_codon:yes stop_codon:yes gene_type:complete
VIDERALVGQNVTIDPSVSIGPFSIIEDSVSIDEGTWIGPHVVIRRNTRIGKNNRIYQFSSVGEDPQYAGYEGEETFLSIGDSNLIREFCTLHRGSPAGSGTTYIGNNNLIMAYAHIAHDSTLGNHIVFANGASLAGHVEIGNHAILGGFTLVHQFCRIGAHAMTGIGTICLKDIPPYILAAGNTAQPHGLNIRGLRRSGFSQDAISALQEAYRICYRRNLTLTQAITRLQVLADSSSEVKAFLEFLNQTKRGIIR